MSGYTMAERQVLVAGLGSERDIVWHRAPKTVKGLATRGLIDMQEESGGPVELTPLGAIEAMKLRPPDTA